jgi:cell division protein FtsQ
VENAQVRRVWPDNIRVQVTRRQADALWKRGQDATVIDQAGRDVANVRWNELGGLPVITGAGAAEAAAPLITAVERTSALNGRLDSAARVSDRRWDLKLKNGAVLTLPAENPGAALSEVDRLQACCQILDRPVARIDLRAPGRVVVR